MNLLQQFQQKWENNFSYLHPTNCSLLLAVSGGVDSVVLLDLLYHLGFHLAIAHVNFQLRDEESNRDEQFVKDIAAKYQVKCFIKRVNTAEFAVSEKVSIQVAARKIRYQWFSELLNEDYFNDYPNKLIVTAHHANDQIETVLFRFFRGTGLIGLQGIPQKNNQIIRPLLFAYKNNILSYAQENNLQWVDDSSNSSSYYTRNFIRLQLMPILHQHFPEIDITINENIHRLTEAAQIYQEAITAKLKKLMIPVKDGIQVPIALLKKTAPFQTIVWELVKQFNADAHQISEIVKLLDAQNGSVLYTDTHRFIKHRNWLFIQPKIIQNVELIAINECTDSIHFGNAQLHFQQLQTPKYIQLSTNELLLDEATISFPLVLRKWKTGDYFYPFGMTHKKKISRFLADLKLSLPEKESVWVLEMNKKIIWVIGYRADNRFKIKSNTKKCIKITYLK
jgi:tRNA(Ile)-lysidine synthase